MKKIYNITKGQLITLWIFGLLFIYLHFNYTNQIENKVFIYNTQFRENAAMVFMTILLVIIFALIFYTIGWRNHRKTYNKTKEQINKNEDKPHSKIPSAEEYINMKTSPATIKCQRCDSKNEIGSKYCIECNKEILFSDKEKNGYLSKEANRDWLSRIYSGRVSRMQFLSSFVIFDLIMIAVVIIGALIDKDSVLYNIYSIAMIIPIFGGFYCYIGLINRRLHDFGVGGFINIILVILAGGSGIGFLFLLFKKGNSDINEYGKVPSQKNSLKLFIGINE